MRKTCRRQRPQPYLLRAPWYAAAAWTAIALQAARADNPTTLPAVPTTLPTVAAPSGNQLSSQLQIKVSRFRLEGNTVFSTKDLNAAVEPILRQHPDGLLSSEDLEQIRTALTLKYVNAGFINSGAVLPDQSLAADGSILFQIIEGRLSRVNVIHAPSQSMSHNMGGPTTGPITGPSPMAAMDHGEMNSSGTTGAAPSGQESTYNGQPRPGAASPPAPAPDATPFHFLSDGYVSSRVFASAGPPLNLVDLKNRLELLREDPNIKTINAELKPGDVPGESELDLTVTERNPIQFGVSFANNRSPSVGAYRLDVLASDSDLTGHGDALSARWGVLEGAADTLKYSGDDDVSFDYSLPLTPNDLTLLLDYTRSSDLVVEAPFTGVDITSVTDSLAATLRQPIVHDPAKELAAFFTVSSRYNRTFLLDEPFSFSPGAVNGESDVFALRFGPEYTQRSENDALSLRGTLSVGIDGPKATIHSNGEADSRFVAFLGQAQYVHRIPLGNPGQPLADTEGVLRFNTQITPDSLLALEQFSLGGVDTVRGYRENQLVMDNAVDATAEVRLPVTESDGHPALLLIPFLDSGYAWDARNTVEPELISSVGLGLAYTPNDHVDARIYWGIPFKHFSHATDDLQDMGLHFSVTLWAF